MKLSWRSALPGGERLKMPSRRVSIGFLLVFGLLTLVSVTSGAAGVYEAASQSLPANQALLHALQAAVVLLAAHAILGALLFLYVALFTSVIIPDAISACRAIGRGITALPAACRSFLSAARATARRCRDLLAGSRRWLAAVAARLRAMTVEDWFSSLYAAGAIAIAAGILYLGWGWASALHGKLPSWLRDDDHSFMPVLLIDWLLCIIPLTILWTVWAEIVRLPMSYIRRWRQDQRKRS